jgi:hypothetical protein
MDIYTEGTDPDQRDRRVFVHDLHAALGMSDVVHSYIEECGLP